MTRLSYIVTIISIAIMCVVAKELYSDKYDNTDVASILQNDKLRNQYYNCVIEKSPCITADAKFLKEVIFEALYTNCERCTDKQKEEFKVIMEWYTKNKPEEWKILLDKSKEIQKKNTGQ
ncbi:ejaculatory bulb-specific protein 3 [Monomorium pharaonis]|uniref:ejaculatory bulb-specific protein 3 n=1 Tax=Monomorium pharaonis TaxID=307658 RepID=UPI00063F9643|nr:ejaculatory bulb-specific protein 3 [Monomorium pharaonis]